MPFAVHAETIGGSAPLWAERDPSASTNSSRADQEADAHVVARLEERRLAADRHAINPITAQMNGTASLQLEIDHVLVVSRPFFRRSSISSRSSGS